MRLELIGVGRMRPGPEQELVVRYIERARSAGRAAGFSDIAVRDIDESRARRAEDRKAEEAAAILARVPAGASLVLLDEGGELLSSRAFAAALATRRDQGARTTALVLGGPDGLAGMVRATASLVVSLGRMTYPHQLARILVAEQIYRSITILSRHPYHRD